MTFTVIGIAQFPFDTPNGNDHRDLARHRWRQRAAVTSPTRPT